MIISAIEVGLFRLSASRSTDSQVTHASKHVTSAWPKKKKKIQIVNFYLAVTNLTIQGA